MFDYSEGIEQGILFLDGSAYPWNGISEIRVSDDTEKTSAFFDGCQVRSGRSNGILKFSLECFTYPAVIDESPNATFSFAWIETGSTRVLHILQEVTLHSDSFGYSQREPTRFSIQLISKPVKYGNLWTPHSTIDLSSVDAAAAELLLNTLNGTDNEPPIWLSPEKIFEILFQFVTVSIIDHGNGIFTAIGPDSMVYLTEPTKFVFDYPNAQPISVDRYTLSSY